MTAFAIFRTFQMISAAAWLWCLFRTAPAMVRVMRRHSIGDDSVRMILWFIAADQIGFCLRWFVFPRALDVMAPDELAWWSGLYALSIICATGASLAMRESRNDAR